MCFDDTFYSRTMIQCEGKNLKKMGELYFFMEELRKLLFSLGFGIVIFGNISLQYRQITRLES